MILPTVAVRQAAKCRETYDIGASGLNWALGRSPSPEELLGLVALARKHFGWFSKQTSRAFEYPWVLQHVGEITSKSVLDVGTGVSPLPLSLAARGAQVVTIDHSPTLRRLGEDQESWNGWGFFDYSCLDPNIHSRNEDVLAAEFGAWAFEVICSVSVIEHMPSAARVQLWNKVAEWLALDGVLLLTVDLVPNTDRLWNRNQGHKIESDTEHGDLATLERELSTVGFKLVLLERLRGLRETRVDCAMTRFVRE